MASSVFTNSIVPFLVFGGEKSFYQNCTETLTLGSATTSFTLVNTNPQGPPTKGWVHMKASTGAGTSPTIILSAYFSDGTNTEAISMAGSAYALDSSHAATSLNLVVPFCIDIVATSLNVVSVLGGSATPTCKLDVEIIGCV